jgi:predicted  nucleic acid-binding Zn-ribbon protein
MHTRITELRTQLVTSLSNQFEREIDHSIEHIHESIAPYTRFVRSERNNLEEIKTGLAGIQRELERMKETVDQVVSSG